MSQISLDQLRAFHAVVAHGGYARAAEALHRSQSSISYQVTKLQQQLGLELLSVVGRKAELTPHGEAVLKQARQLLNEDERLDKLVDSLKQRWEPSVRLVVDTAFPTRLLMQALQQFAPFSRGSRVQLTEVVLSGAEDAVLGGEADLAIAARAPQGYLAEALMNMEFVCVAHPDHVLHRLGRELVAADLEREMQVNINDSGSRSKMDVGWLGAEHQWSVSRIDTAVSAIAHGLGFGWLPDHVVEDPQYTGQLQVLPLREGQRYTASLSLVFGNPDAPGPATRQLADNIRQCVQHELS